MDIKNKKNSTGTYITDQTPPHLIILEDVYNYIGCMQVACARQYEHNLRTVRTNDDQTGDYTPQLFDGAMYIYTSRPLLNLSMRLSMLDMSTIFLPVGE